MKLQNSDSDQVDSLIVAPWLSEQPGEQSAMEPSIIPNLPRPTFHTLQD